MACAMQTLDASVKQRIEDTLGYKVTVWKLSTLVSQKRSIQMAVEAPKSVNHLQSLASSLKFDFTLKGYGEIAAMRDRWTAIYLLLPLHAKLVHVVWKYISTHRNHTSLFKEMLDECKQYARNGFEQLLGDVWKKLDANNKEKAMKHIFHDDVQEQLLAIDSLSPDYIKQMQHYVSSQNSTLELIKEALNQVHFFTNSTEKIDGDLYSFTLSLVRQHIAFAENLQKQLKEKEAEGQQLQEIIFKLKDALKDSEAKLKEKDMNIAEKDAKLKEKDKTIADNTVVLQGVIDFMEEQRSSFSAQLHLQLHQVRKELEEERKEHRSALEQQHETLDQVRKELEENIKEHYSAVKKLQQAEPKVVVLQNFTFNPVQDISKEDLMTLSSHILLPIKPNRPGNKH